MKFKFNFKAFYYSAFLLLAFFTILITSTSITYIVGQKISYFQMFFSILLSIVTLLFFFKDVNLKTKTLSILISIIVVLLSAFACNKYYDINWDSNTYHKDAIGALKNGWNPIKQDYIKFYKQSNYRNMDAIGDKIFFDNGLWQTNYAKGTWYIGANFYYLFNDIEVAKIFNIIVAYICFILSFNFIFELSKKKLLSFALAIIFSISPVSIVQLFSYYNDGVLYNLLLCLLMEFILFIKKNSKQNLLNTCLLIIICCNIKFTGFGYGGIFCFALYLYYIIINFKNKKVIINTTITLFITVIIAIIIAGFQPYVTNFITKGNIFYPLAGKDKVDIVTTNQPQFFNNKSTIKKFGYSIFSNISNSNKLANGNSLLKIPFDISNEDLTILSRNDIRISGFGVWFSGIFIISIISLIYGLINSYSKKQKLLFNILTIVNICSLLLILFISESWWARYTPFVYFISLSALTYLAINNKKVIEKILLFSLIGTMFINIGFFVKYNLIDNYYEQKETRKIINYYKHSGKTMHINYYYYFAGFLYTLDDNDVKYDLKNVNNSKIQKKIFRYLSYWSD